MQQSDTPKPTSDRKDAWDRQDEDLRREQETVVPHSDAPSRANITGPGSGADGGSAHHEK